MHLKQLEILGFKSFAKKSIIEFKSPITAIVGPNGSGKSNIAEAFRFALGEQSVKSMRGKKGEDLIWNGTQETPRANRAMVKTLFDNSKRIFNIDFDEVSVERTVSRDGISEYYINSSQVRLKDVVELLLQAHIGASGHHIISQGEADRILVATPKERKETLEEALGLKLYQYKKRESQRKLDKTRENIEKVESLRREIAPHLRFLKKQVEKASKAEEIRERLAQMAKEHLKKERVYIEKGKKELSDNRDPLLTKLRELEEEMKRLEEEVARGKKEGGHYDRLGEAENKIRGERKERENFEREIGRIEGEISANQKNVEAIKERNKTLEGKVVSLKEVSELAQEIKNKITSRGDDETPGTLKAIIAFIKDKLEIFLESRKENQNEKILEETEGRNTELEIRKKELEAEIEKKNKIIALLEIEISKIREEMMIQAGTLAESEKKMLIISREESDIRSRLDLLKIKEERIKTDENNFEIEARELIGILGQMLLGFENLEIDPSSQDYGMAREETRREIERLKVRLEEFGAAGGQEILNEFRDTSERDAFLEKELIDLNLSSESLLQMIAELDEKLENEFKTGMEKVNAAFREFFSLMFGGGEAGLTLIKNLKRKVKNYEEENENYNAEVEKGEVENEEGIEVTVSLPRKRIKGLEMLSGGERALTSIALLFAISQVNPPPFIILDETDAALDEANSKKYGDMIENLSKSSQLILITHNRETMSRAGIIYGVTMGGNGISRLLSLAFDEAVIVAK